MKKFYLFAAAALALGSCSSDEFLGEDLSTAPGKEGAITFAGFKPNIHRAPQTGATAAGILDSKFEVYGVKKLTETTYSNVFAHTEATTITDAQTYDVWWDNAANTTTSNTKGWEYVQAAGFTLPGTATTPAINGAQTIKYWDYSALQYEFVAYSKSTATAAAVSNITKDGFTIKGTAAAVSDLFIADKKVVKKSNTNYKEPVTLTFRTAGAKVRLGIYETVPGYDVKSITFRSAATPVNFADNSANAILDGAFVGNTSDEFTANVTYETTEPMKAKVAFVDAAKKTFFDFGAFNIVSNKMGETSTDPSWTDKNYTEVLPNTVHEGTMTLYVNYVLVNTTTQEEIKVTGAKAVVPKEYMKWQPNHSYTYLFKITDKTNGTTGGTSDPAGLFPITFDACVETITDGEYQGTVTTVADYSITTYQDGSVVADGVEYKKDKQIDIVIKKVADGTIVSTESSNLKIYSGIADGVTEADLDVDAIRTSGTTEVTPTAYGTKTTFTPSAAGNYAVIYTESGKTYSKIIVVK